MLPYTATEPDCEELREILLRKTKGKRVHFLEHAIDDPVLRKIAEDCLDIPWVPEQEDKKKYWDTVTEIHRKLGYDAFKMIGLNVIDRDFADRKRAKKKDSGSVTWSGVIENREDFEQYGWPVPADADFETIEYVHDHLPDGMGLFISPHQGPFALCSNFFFGIENLSFFIVDKPDLVKDVFDRLSRIKLEFIKRVIDMPRVMGVWAHDDMGHKTATIVSPGFLREYNLPHHKKMAEAAHAAGKLYILHSCGNMYSLMDELIDDVRIDAKHSFEDLALPVTEAKKRYGDRVGIIGGVDVDRLCRASKPELVDYTRSILEICTQNGGYALGSGNSIAGYVPLENYLAMMQTGAEFPL